MVNELIDQCNYLNLEENRDNIEKIMSQTEIKEFIQKDI